MILTRDFEKFQGGPTLPSSEKMHVTISPRHIVLINANAYRLMGKPQAVHLYYSREKDTIAVEPTSPRLPMAFPLKEKHNSWHIHTAPFCRHFGIRPATTLRFINPSIDEGGRLTLKLSETVTTSKGPRRKKKQE
jgi:hypothetical protein